MKQHQICIPLVDRDFSPENKQALLDVGGKTQVPCPVLSLMEKPCMSPMILLNGLKKRVLRNEYVWIVGDGYFPV